MKTTPAAETFPELIVATRCPDGTHTATSLSKQVRTGRALRVRRGIYIRAQDWIEASPWQRYRFAVAATALDSDPVFCRETALLLHGVPLLGVPAAVLARTMRRGGSGRAAVPPLTGRLRPEEFRRLYTQKHNVTGEVGVHLLRNVPQRLLRPPQLAGVSRPEMMVGLRTGSLPLHEVSAEPGPRMGVRGPVRFRAEPLELALIDAASRMPFDQAVMALDWAKAKRSLDLDPWLKYLSNGRMQRRWQRAWEFATPLSESPGESRSRALIEELGFARPALQTSITTDRGRFRVDFCWPEDGVVGEFDGRVKYFDEATLNGRDPKEVLFQEKQREDALRREGWTVVRWSWADLNDTARLVSSLRRAGVRLRP